MNLEKDFRRFQDFGLIATVAFALTAVDVSLSQTLHGTAYIRIAKILGFACLMLCFAAVIAAAWFDSVPPMEQKRSLSERLIAGSLASAVITGCFVIVYLQ